MTLPTLIESVDKEFDEKFVAHDRHVDLSGKYHKEPIKLIQGESEKIEQIKSFHRSSLLRMLEGMKEEICEIIDGKPMKSDIGTGNCEHGGISGLCPMCLNDKLFKVSHMLNAVIKKYK